jgi:hypothetical protein
MCPWAQAPSSNRTEEVLQCNPAARLPGESPGYSPAPARMPCADNAAVKGLEVFAHQKIWTQPQFREGWGKGVGGCGVGASRTQVGQMKENEGSAICVRGGPLR